jgi:hypothetical protein
MKSFASLYDYRFDSCKQHRKLIPLNFRLPLCGQRRQNKPPFFEPLVPESISVRIPV